MDSVLEACSTAVSNTNTLTYFLVFGLIVIVAIMMVQMSRQREESQRLNDRIKMLQNQNEGLQRTAVRLGSAQPPAHQPQVRAERKAPAFVPVQNSLHRTMHDEPLGSNPVDRKAVQALGLLNMGATNPGRANLFQQADQFDGKDVPIENLFPTGYGATPKDSNEALQQTYSFENFKRAHDINHLTFLTPINTRTGENRFGERRDPVRERERRRIVSAAIEESGDPEALAENMMIPLSEHFYDLLHETKRQRGFAVDPEDVANMNYSALGAGSQLSLTHRPFEHTPASAKTLHDKMSRAVSTSDWRQANADMSDLLDAAEQAKRGGMRPRPLEHHQLSSLAHWAHNEQSKGTQYLAQRVANAYGQTIPARAV
jgi:hypothetical protein